MESINDHLPEEMIFQILVWLPVITLLRCKSVCNSWKSIISSPNFIRAQYAISQKKLHPFSLLRVVLRDESQDLFMDTRGEHSVKLSLPSFMSDVPMHVRSCKGLVTLSDINVGLLCIWNPLSKLFKLLPKPQINEPTIKLPQIFGLELVNNVGFGYDSLSNDYKILRVVFGTFTFGAAEVCGIVGELYSVNADSWKMIWVPQEMYDFKHDPAFKSVCVDRGVLYFQGTDEILSFDLHDEVFGMYKYPDLGERMSDVLDFEGSAALILKSDERESILSLWTLDDAGGNFSWTKKFNIEPDMKIDYVLLYLGDGQFLAQDYGAGYFFYDDRNKGKKKSSPPARVFTECTSVVRFSGSLLSLEGFEQRE